VQRFPSPGSSRSCARRGALGSIRIPRGALVHGNRMFVGTGTARFFATKAQKAANAGQQHGRFTGYDHVVLVNRVNAPRRPRGNTRNASSALRIQQPLSLSANLFRNEKKNDWPRCFPQVLCGLLVALQLQSSDCTVFASANPTENAGTAPLEAEPYLKQGRPVPATTEPLTLGHAADVEHRVTHDATGTLIPLDIVQLRAPRDVRSPPVRSRDAVLVRYVAFLEDGTVIEDKRNGKTPVFFRAGTATLPAAVDLGVEGMRVGEQRRVRVRAVDNFHGVNLRLGAAAVVPRESTLYYDIELVGINPYS